MGGRSGCAGGGYAAAKATDQEFLRNPDGLEWNSDVLRRRRVHEHAAWQQQPMEPGQRNDLARLGLVGKQQRHFPLLQVHDRISQGTSITGAQPLLARGSALVRRRRAGGPWIFIA